MLKFSCAMLKYHQIRGDFMNPAKTEDECPLFILVNGLISLTYLHTKIFVVVVNYHNEVSPMSVKQALHCSFHDRKSSCPWSHFNSTRVYCREWNQHVLSVKQCHCIEKYHPVSQIFQAPPPNKHHCIHHPLHHHVNQVAFFCHHYWQILLIWQCYLFLNWCIQHQLKNKLHSLVS